MKKSFLMTERGFRRVTRIKDFDDLGPKEVDYYTAIFLEKIRNFYDSGEREELFWCPKCESLEAFVSINREKGHAMATCANCRMALMVVLSEIPK